MNIEDFRDYCLSLKGATESLPFGPNTLVYKVGSKMFALIGMNDEKFWVNLKNLPEKNQELQEEYTFIIPGYHMDKKHWITIYPQASKPLKFYQSLIKESYELVVKNSLSKAEKESLSSN